jgi:hypothetical protein
MLGPCVPRVWPRCGSAVSVALVTAAVFGLRAAVPVLSLGVLYPFAVLPAALLWRRAWGVVVAVASMLAFTGFSSRRGTRSSWPTGRTGWHLRPPRASRESCGSPCSTRRSRCSCGSLKGCNTRGHRLRRDLTEILDRRALDHRAVRREPRPVAWAIPAPLRSVPLHVAAEVGAGS